MNTFNCDYCGEAIPYEVIAKRHYTAKNLPGRLYCNRDHQILARIANDEYKAMSVIGRDARSKGVAESNRAHPRRGKK
jgi:hypothetical protein